MNASRIRRTLIAKGLVHPSKRTINDGEVVAVRRVDDRPCTRVVPVVYKRSILRHV